MIEQMDPPADVNIRLRRLPKVDDVLRDEPAQKLLARAPRWAVVEAVRAEIDRLRARLLAGGEPAADGVAVEPAALSLRVADLLRPSLGRVLNATGVVLHTNLGRAPLAEPALARMVEVGRSYSNLEYRIDERRRGSRHEHVATVLGRLTGADAALVVNNNAAAVLLVLAALAAGREVIVSRGELVEIGGSFRIPDVLRASGARLVEVGTTNRTHARDYERAIGAETALLMKVHQSNFAQVGFTAEVSVAELSAIGRARNLPTVGARATCRRWSTSARAACIRRASWVWPRSRRCRRRWRRAPTS
jgi:L-seryl-tRNA(Ser) seleniumtransferase